MLAQSQKVDKPGSPPQTDLKRENLLFAKLEYGARTEGFASPPSHDLIPISSSRAPFKVPDWLGTEASAFTGCELCSKR